MTDGRGGRLLDNPRFRDRISRTEVDLMAVEVTNLRLLDSLRNGRQLVFVTRWDPAQAIDVIREERVTQFNGAPSMVMQLLAQPGFDDPAQTGTLAGLGFGGAGLPQRLIDEVMRRRPNSLSGIGFGLTETNGVGCGNLNENYMAGVKRVGGSAHR